MREWSLNSQSRLAGLREWVPKLREGHWRRGRRRIHSCGCVWLLLLEWNRYQSPAHKDTDSSNLQWHLTTSNRPTIPCHSGLANLLSLYSLSITLFTSHLPSHSHLTLLPSLHIWYSLPFRCLLCCCYRCLLLGALYLKLWASSYLVVERDGVGGNDRLQARISYAFHRWAWENPMGDNGDYLLGFGFFQPVHSETEQSM